MTALGGARSGRSGNGGDANENPGDRPPPKALGEGEQSGITMHLFKKQITARQSSLFSCLPVLVEMRMT
jgi:hypothetical protein